MKRVAYVCADAGIPVFGRKGGSIHVREVIRGLRRNGLDVTLFARRLGGEAPGDLADLTVQKIRPAPNSADRELAAIQLNPEFVRAVHRHGPFDWIYERQSLWNYGTMEYAETSGIPGLLEVNAPLLEEQMQYRELAHTAAARQTVARTLRAATSVVAVSQWVADYTLRTRAERGRAYVIPNGVDTTRFTSFNGQHTNKDTFTVGFVGSLKPWHGVEVLVDAFATLASQTIDTRLLIIGDGPQHAALAQDLDRRGLAERVTFTGAVDADEIPALLATVDAAVAPYPALDDFYFSPLKIFEYMAAGRAVVASAIGQINDIVSDGQTGLLCRPGRSDDLAAALLRLRSDTSLRDRLGAAAREAAVVHHSWDAVSNRIVELAREAEALCRQANAHSDA